jgi:hypothetical protein
MVGHKTISRTSTCPVTAAVINAERRSRDRSIKRSASTISLSIFTVSASD